MERQYFYYHENEQFGPFVLADIRDMHLPEDMPVWYEGMAEWQPAATLPELQDLYQAPPPQQQRVVQAKGSPLLKILRIALGIFCLLMVFGMVGSGLENNPIEPMPFVLAVIFLGLGLWLILKKSKYKRGGAQNQDDYTDADGAIYAQQMNMMQQDDVYDDGGDFD